MIIAQNLSLINIQAQTHFFHFNNHTPPLECFRYFSNYDSCLIWSKERKESIWQQGKSMRPFLVWAVKKKRKKAFDRLLQTRQPRKKLMAMINDKGPEESGDTAATYIIPPHQSEHLPGPSPSLSLPYLCPLPHSPQLPPSRSLSLHLSFFSSSWKEENKWQRGDKVNKKMACKISRYPPLRGREDERKTGCDGAVMALWFHSIWLFLG